MNGGNRPKKIAIVLFNLGGPDGPDAILPFLVNLFSDAAILRVAAPIRWLLAQIIARRRAPIARKVYAQIGGASPILEETKAQASALERTLQKLGGNILTTKTFIVMRYWHPRAIAVVSDLRKYSPDQIILLPLYPQFSTVTTESSANEWFAMARDINVPTQLIGCYGTESWFIQAHANAIAPLLSKARVVGAPIVLFSAHGLPTTISEAGDPYAAQTQHTAQAIAAELGLADREWSLCYQSRVGPLDWLGPSTDDEVRRAGAKGAPVVVAPIAFVSEHSETLVELDIEYRSIANAVGVPAYFRAPALGVSDDFIHGLAEMVCDAVNGILVACPSESKRLCRTPVCSHGKEGV